MTRTHRPGSRALGAAVAAAIATLAFAGSLSVLHAEPDLSLDGHVEADLAIEDVANDLDATLDGAIDTAIGDIDVDAVDDAGVCSPSCDEGNDAFADARIRGGDTVDNPEAEACILGTCDAGTVQGDGLLIGGAEAEDGDILGDTSGAVCVLAECSQGNAMWDALVAGTVGSALPPTVQPAGATDADADFCVMGTCRTSAFADTPGTGPGPGTSVDGAVCLLADCGPATTSPSGNAPQGVVPGGGEGGPVDDLIGDPQLPSGPDSPGSPQGETTGDGPTGPDTPTSQGVPGLPNAGFAPFAGSGVGGWGYAALVLGALAAAWYAGVRLIWRRA